MIKEIEKTEVWEDMIQLKEFNADDFYEDFFYSLDDDDVNDVMSDIPGSPIDKVLITLIRKWDEYIDIVNTEYEKYGDVSIKKLSNGQKIRKQI